MTIDWVGVVGVIVAILGIIDARRERNKREKAVIVAHSVIERTYGLLIGIKPFVAPLGAMHLAAVEDGLLAINEQRPDLKNL